MNILIIDDNIQLHYLFQQLIEDRGDLTFAKNGKQGLEIFKKAATSEDPFHLILFRLADVAVPHIAWHC